MIYDLASRLPRKFGRLNVPGAYFPGQIPPPEVKLAVSSARPPEGSLKKQLDPQSRHDPAVEQKRKRILDTYDRLKNVRAVAADQGCQPSYVYKCLHERRRRQNPAREAA